MDIFTRKTEMIAADKPSSGGQEVGGL